MGLIEDAINNVKNWVNSLVNSAISGVKTWARNTINAAIAGIQKVTNYFYETIYNAYNTFREYIYNYTTNVYESFYNTYNTFKEYVYKYVTNVYETINNTYNTFKEYITKVYKTFNDYIYNYTTNVYETINKVYNTFNEYINNTYETFVTNVYETYNTTKQYITNIIGVTAEWVNGRIAYIISYINDAVANIDPAGFLTDPPSYILETISNIIAPPLLGSLGGELVAHSPAIWYWVPPVAGRRNLVSGWIYEGVRDVWDGILKSLGNIAEMMFGAVDFVIATLKDGVTILLGGFLNALTYAMIPGSPPQEIAIASEVLMQTMMTKQIEMIDMAYKSEPTAEDIQQNAVSMQTWMLAAATAAIGSGLAADLVHPFKNMQFQPTVREMVYWSGIPAVTGAIAITPTAIGLLTPLRYSLMEKWTPMVPPATDLIRFSVREVYLAERYEALVAYYPGGEYDRLMAKHGFKLEFREHYWMAHWVLPSVGQLNDMLYRGIITAELWTTYVRYNDLIPEMIGNLEQIIYKPYTRVDIRRMWDIGVVTDAEVLENYKWLGYDQEHAERMTLWTKAYVIAGDVRALYSKGWIDEAGAKLMLVEAGVPEERVDVFMKRLVKSSQPARMEQERDITKTDILRMFKNGIFTASETVGLLMDIGYDEDEAGYLILLYENQPLLEMKELTMSQILKSYRYEVYTRVDAKIALQEAGWSETAAETLLQLEDIKLTDAQTERARERDLSRTDIIKSIGAEIIDTTTGYNYLGYLGYSDWEIRIIGALEGIEFPAVGG